jgi:hypothetical protein
MYYINMYCTLYTYILYTIHYTLYTIHYTLYTYILYTIYIYTYKHIYYTLYTHLHAHHMRHACPHEGFPYLHAVARTDEDELQTEAPRTQQVPKLGHPYYLLEQVGW